MRLKLKEILTREQKIKLQKLVFENWIAFCSKHNEEIEPNYYRIKRCDKCKYIYYIKK